MVGINFLNYLDRWVASAAAPLIQKEFHIDDAQVGLLGTAFLLVYAVAALPFGYSGDRGLPRTAIAPPTTLCTPPTLFSDSSANFVLPRGLPPTWGGALRPAVLYFVLHPDAFVLASLRQRRFGMSLSAAGLLAGVLLLVGGLIGSWSGGWMADRRAKTRPAAHLEV